jgi:hypothetical protein
MGAGTGNRNNMDAARRQQAMEGQAMRRRAIQQQEQFAPTQEQGAALLRLAAPQRGFGLEATPSLPWVVASEMNRGFRDAFRYQLWSWSRQQGSRARQS